MEPGLNRQHREIRAPVLYLPEYLYQEPMRVLRAWRSVRRWSTYAAARRLWVRDLRRDRTTNRGRRFGQALVLAHELPADIGALYAHYMHTPASVTRYAAALRGLPWCASAHAKDIWTTPAWEEAEKLRECAWATTCTAAGAAHLRELAPGAEVLLTYHGLDASRFAPPHRTRGPDGSDRRRPVRLLGVARLVPKKGVDVLLHALAALPAELHWRYEHVGNGPLSEGLAAAAARLGLADRIAWRGALPQEEVIAAYRAADLCVLANRVAADGDRDGLPNVLLEAGAMELAVVASRTAGVSELVEDRLNGRLVPPDDPAALAAALAMLIRDPAARLRLGRAGRHRVLEQFATEPGLDRLAARLGGVLDRTERAAA